VSETRQDTNDLENSVFLQDGLGILARIIARDIRTKRHPEPMSHAVPSTDITQKQ
jgi:hypothetical protein